MSESETVSVTVTERFVRFGVQHELGEVLQLPAEDAAELLDAALVEPAEMEPEPGPKPEPEPEPVPKKTPAKKG